MTDRQAITRKQAWTAGTLNCQTPGSRSSLSQQRAHAGTRADTARIHVVKKLVAGNRSVSVILDRDKILRWFIDTRQFLDNADLKEAEAAKQLDRSINTLRVSQSVTPRSNDFGVDGCVFHLDGIIVVQCKRYASDNAVGRPPIM